MDDIAILVSTSPLRKTTTRGGRTKQRLNLDACLELAERFDIVIIASLSHDAVFEYVGRHLSREVRPKFRLYPRSFFHTFVTPEVMSTTDDPRNPGWEQILSENDIQFEVLQSKIGADHRYRQKKFDWRDLGAFVTDPRVTLVSGGEGQLFYEKPAAASR